MPASRMNLDPSLSDPLTYDYVKSQSLPDFSTPPVLTSSEAAPNLLPTLLLQEEI